MVSLNRSFLYGICFASLTWVISLYLYFQLTKNDIMSNKIPTQQSWSFKSKLIEPLQKYSKNLKTSNNYINSRHLIKQLQPVSATPKATDHFEEGEKCVSHSKLKVLLIFYLFQN